MQNIPKIVQERLKAAAPVGNHPDADVLTAFAERLLPEVERGVVLEHLARCGDCRDVVALGLPGPEAVQTVVVPAGRGWLTWPALRWGFVAAGVVIVSVGILQYQRHLQPRAMVAKQTTRPEAMGTYIETRPAAPSPAAAPAEKQERAPTAVPAVAPAVSAGTAGRELTQNKLIAPAVVPQASAVPQQAGAGVASGVVHSQFPHGPNMPTQWQQQTARVQVSPSMPPAAGARQQAAGMAARAQIPSASEAVEV